MLAAVVVLCAACAGGTEAATGDVGGATTSALVATTALPTGPSLLTAAPPATASTTAETASTVPATTTPTHPPSPPAVVTTSTPATTTSAVPSTPGPAVTTPVPVRPTAVLGPRTSCQQVVHIGDSTSEYLWDAATMGGDAAATMEARYRAVGVEEVVNDSSGGRSMVERLNRQQRNAIEVATEVRESGYRGCWVLMIGTNDAANVAAGANVGADERIESMLAIIGSDPVLWVNTASSSSIAWYGDDSMQAFNAALAEAAARHPNLWVFDWAAEVQPDWYGPDGLHPDATGRAWRAALTAQELAWAFPG